MTASFTALSASSPPVRSRVGSAIEEPRWVRLALIAITVGFLSLGLLVPLAAVFTEALRKGLGTYLEALRDPAAMAAIRLTLLAAAIAVPANLVFGVAAAWAIGKF